MSDHFGSEAESWNHDEDGKPGINLFANAVQVWTIMNGDGATVAQAASAFACPPQMIVECVEHHYWMFLEGPDDDFSKMVIAHEGE